MSNESKSVSDRKQPNYNRTIQRNWKIRIKMEAITPITDTAPKIWRAPIKLISFLVAMVI